MFRVTMMMPMITCRWLAREKGLPSPTSVCVVRCRSSSVPVVGSAWFRCIQHGGWLVGTRCDVLLASRLYALRPAGRRVLAQCHCYGRRASRFHWFTGI